MFAGKTIDPSHLDLGDSLGEGIPTCNFLTTKASSVMMCCLSRYVWKGVQGKATV